MKKKNTPIATSPYIDEIIEKKPAWLIRFGIGAMLFFLILLLLAAWIVKYPDVISAKIYVSTPIPPIEVVAKVNGVITKSFYNADLDTIQKDYPIFLIKNNSNYEQVQELSKVIRRTNREMSFKTSIDSIRWFDELGIIQQSYNEYMFAQLELQRYYKEQPLLQQIENLKRIIKGNKYIQKQSKKIVKTSKKDLALREKEYARYKKLFNKGVISASEYENTNQSLLQKEMGFVNDNKTYRRDNISIANLNSQLFDLQTKKIETERKLEQRLDIAKIELINRIKDWEDTYVISSPVNGRLSFFETLNEGDFITSGQQICTVIPTQKQSLEAKGRFSVVKAGKVKKQNKVIIKLDAYPYEEYGTIVGYVSQISEIPIDGEYSIRIELPDKLKTTYEHKIIFKQRLTGTADIITKDQSILRRMFNQFESLLKN